MLSIAIIKYIVCACLLAVAAVVLLILFWPVRYRADGKIEDTFSFRFVLDWFFHAAGLSATVREKKITVRMHILKYRKTLYRSDKKEASAKAGKKKQPQDTEKPQEPWQKKLAAYAKKARRFWQEEENRKLVTKILQKIKFLLKHLAPKQIRTKLHFSVGSPDGTGKLVAAISVFPLVYEYDFGLYPDFEADAPYLRGTFHVKGSFRLAAAAIVAVSLLSNKKVRKLIKKVRRMQNE